MAIQIFHKTEAGKGIEFADGKYNVKAGQNITVTDSGVNAVIPTHVTNIAGDSNGFTATRSDGTAVVVAFPEQTVDVKLSGLSFADGKLKGTLSDGTSVETEFSTEIVVAAIEQATDAQKRRLAAALKDVFTGAIRGEEVQDSTGVTKGYLLA